MPLEVRTTVNRLVSEHSHLAWSPAGGAAILVDPGSDVARLLAGVEALGRPLEAILLTHRHHDHTAGVAAVADATRAVVYGPWDGPGIDQVRDDQVLSLECGPVEVIATPGHTPESVCYRGDGVLFTGDTLFVNDCGVVPDAAAALALRRSLHETLAALPGDLVIYPGHNYGGISATLEEIRQGNDAMAPRSDAEFLRWFELES